MDDRDLDHRNSVTQLTIADNYHIIGHCPQ
jgi:hypothetical protein